jgi:hypothetical protein
VEIDLILSRPTAAKALVEILVETIEDGKLRTL